MPSFERPRERASSLAEVLVAMSIVVIAGALASSSFKSCTTAHKKVLAGEAVEAEVSLLVAAIERDFIHAATATTSQAKGPFQLRLDMQQADEVTHTYSAQCRQGSPTPLAMAQWKGRCFQTMACPAGASASVRASSGKVYPPNTSPKGGAFAYAMCVKDLGSGSVQVIIDAAVMVDEKQQQPRIFSKEKLLSRNAALGSEVQLLPKP